MSLNIQAALGYLGVFIIGYGACLVRHAIPRGRLPPGGLEAVVNRQHRELQDVRAEIAEFKRQQEDINRFHWELFGPNAGHIETLFDYSHEHEHRITMLEQTGDPYDTSILTEDDRKALDALGDDLVDRLIAKADEPSKEQS